MKQIVWIINCYLYGATLILLAVLALLVYLRGQANHLPNPFARRNIVYRPKEKAQGVLLGKKFGLMAYSPEQDEGHILVMGPSGTGKTSALLIPTLRSWQGTALVVDISGDISANVHTENKIIFDPTAADCIPYDVFASIDAAPDDTERQERLEQLAYLLLPDKANDSEAGVFFTKNGRKMITAALICYYWQALYEAWSDAGCPVPPVMITVANRTETAARIKYAFDHQRIPVPELCNPDLTLRIDSKTLDEAESATGKKADAAAALREMVDTVGQKGKPGEQIRNVISVGMLSEGWDAKTVTHILGLRAFSSQLLCEQVIGRGLRRTSYDLAEGSELFTPEYVNIFGIPFTFLPHESDEQGTPPVTPPKTQVESLKERSEYQISWPNIVRIDQVFKPQLKVDINKIDTLTLQAAETRLRADLAPIIDGKTDLTKCTEIDLQKLDAELRMQRIVFEAAAQVYEQMNASWQNQGTKFALLGQVIQLTQKYIESGAIQINPPMYGTDPVRKRIIYMMNMNRIVQHLWDFIKLEMTSKTVPIFDANRRVRSTADMPTWYTSKPCNITQHSQISHCVYDSGWESTEAYILEKNPHVEAWAKNDHLGFEIVYIYEGVVRKYIPDYLVRLDNGKTLVLETKGRMTSRDVAKRKALSEWVKAVNATGEFGTWANDISFNVADVDSIIQKYL